MSWRKMKVVMPDTPESLAHIEKAHKEGTLAWGGDAPTQAQLDADTAPPPSSRSGVYFGAVMRKKP
jgi:hypothetical protein